MKIFVAASYSSKVDNKTGKVILEYQDWLEEILNTVENMGHTVFCALREDKYSVNSLNSDEAINLDIKRLKESDVVLALLNDRVSGGVQTEIGITIAEGKKLLLAHKRQDDLIYVNKSLVSAGLARELVLPFDVSELASNLT